MMDKLFGQIRQCTICALHLPNKPRPIIQGSSDSRIIIVGQAPGQRVQDSGVPWDDPSGKELRRWLGITPEQFYNEKLVALVPMGFCYPGKGTSGDSPPRPECAPQWHKKVFIQFKKPRIVLLIGQFAQAYYLSERRKTNLTDTVKAFREYLPEYLPLVHPSPRNRFWMKKNPWFEKTVIPSLRKIVRESLPSP